MILFSQFYTISRTLRQIDNVDLTPFLPRGATGVHETESRESCLQSSSLLQYLKLKTLSQFTILYKSAV